MGRRRGGGASGGAQVVSFWGGGKWKRMRMGKRTPQPSIGPGLAAKTGRAL